jgi:lia operon protein LiaG
LLFFNETTMTIRRPKFASVRTNIAASAVALVMLASSATSSSAQTPERRTLTGNDVAVYNIAGVMRVEGGTGGDVTVEVTRGGRDASRLELASGNVRGREALRVVYPNERRIVYRQGDWGRGRSRTSIYIDDDGTFGDDRSDNGRRVDIVGDGDGLDAYADVRVVVPKGKRVSVYLGVGEAKIDNVDGELYVDVSAASVTATRTRGRLSLDTGSGEVRVTDAQGDVTLDTGSGSVEVMNIRGSRLSMDTGSGRVRGTDLVVDEIELDTGSGSVRLAQVQSNRITLDSGSGSVELDLRADVESLRIDSGSGGITLGIPESLGAAIRIDTGSGGIDTDIPVQVRKTERNFLSGTIGDGKGEIVIETGSGGVRLRRS